MPKHTTDTASNSIGLLLKAAREQRGMTQADAASQLNLKVVIIEKLESEQWDNSMATTFVKGYLRAYSRLLKLSEREILQAYDLQTAHLRGQQSAMHSFSRKTSREAADSRFMLATYGFVLLLVGLFFVWFWQTHLLDSEPVAVLPDYVAPSAETPAADLASLAPSPQNTEAPAVSNPAAPEVRNGTSESNPAPALSTAVDTSAAGTSPVVSKVVPDASAMTPATDIADRQVAAEPSDSASELPASSIETTEGETRQLATTPVPETETTVPAATDGVAADIELSFSADCWVSVIDQQQQKLAYGLQKAGSSIQLHGQYPVKLIIGNAAVTSIRVQGKPYDLSQYKAGQVARITLTGAL